MNILITGASKGIGLAAAKQFDKGDNKLFLVATSADSFKDTFRNATLFGADLTKREDVGRLAADILQQTGTLDVLINNAGIMVMKKFEQMTEEDIITMLDLDLRSHILLTHALLPALRKSGNPQIVFMSSMAAKSSIVGESVYAAAKSGISNFANVLRNELGPTIRVSTVHAWGVDTWGAPKPEEFIQPSDVAETMEFIVTRPSTAMVESIDLSNPTQWRGAQAPWSPV
jgi:NADP-dependent 3-hydroxy acid dehydrogenase YdfG